MAVDMFLGGTEWFANEITILRGTVADIVAVGIYHNVDPSVKPTVADFTTVVLEDGTGPLADGTKIDIMTRIGEKAGAHWNPTVPGDYQRWALIQTAQEDIIRKLDIVTIL